VQEGEPISIRVIHVHVETRIPSDQLRQLLRISTLDSSLHDHIKTKEKGEREEEEGRGEGGGERKKKEKKKKKRMTWRNISRLLEDKNKNRLTVWLAEKKKKKEERERERERCSRRSWASQGIKGFWAAAR